jgi:RND family efflux transporter MFP subunit
MPGASRHALVGAACAAGLLLLAAGFQALRSTAAEPPPSPPLLLPGAVIQLESGFDLQHAFSGQLMSYQDAGLGFEVGGVVDAVLVVEGDRVAAGQVLARLRQAEQRAMIAEQEAALAEAQAAVAQAQAQLRLTELVRDRRVRLAEREVLAAEALETAEADLESQSARVRAAEAAVQRAQAGLTRSRVRLEQTELRAPHEGVVAAIPARAGQALDAGASAVRLVDLNRPLVHVGVPVAVAATLTPGAHLILAMADERHPAKLISLAPAVDASTRTVLAILRPDGPLPTVRAGELVRVQVVERNEDPGAWLPLSALVEGRRGLWAGHFLQPLAQPLDDPDNRPLGLVEQRPLQLVHVDGDRAFVRGPFSQGEVYLRTGLHRTVPGQQVRVHLD